MTSNTSGRGKMSQGTTDANSKCMKISQKQRLNALFSSAVCSFTVMIGLVISKSILKYQESGNQDIQRTYLSHPSLTYIHPKMSRSRHTEKGFKPTVLIKCRVLGNEGTQRRGLSQPSLPTAVVVGQRNMSVLEVLGVGQ